jgi:tetratricopeptide (TPR) repeat protein
MSLHPRTVAACAVLALATGSLGAYSVAVMPPLNQRLHAQGVDAFNRGDYKGAIAALNRSPDTDRNPRELLTRARAHQHLNEFTDALADYEKADALTSVNKPDGRIKACRGYCLSQRGMFHEARLYFDAAIRAGFVSPELVNDLGCCYERENNLIDAPLCLTQAIRLNPDLRPAYFNRAMVDLKRAYAYDSADRPKNVLSSSAIIILSGFGPKPLQSLPALGFYDPVHFPSAGIEDIEKAIALGSQTPDAYITAAQLYAFASRLDSRLRPRMIDYLQKAVGAGARVAQYSYAFQRFESDPEYKRLLLEPPKTPVAREQLFVDPVTDFDLFVR